MNTGCGESAKSPTNSEVFTMPASNQHQQIEVPPGNFSINKVAEYLSVHRSTVERLLRAGELGDNWWRIGSKIIIPKQNVFEYERREQEKRAAAKAA
jgi:excisionase family DNA binding protein